MKSQKNFTYVSYLRSISCPFCTEKWFPRHKNAPKSNFYHPPSVAMIHLKRPLGKPLKPIETYQIHLFNIFYGLFTSTLPYCFLLFCSHLPFVFYFPHPILGQIFTDFSNSWSYFLFLGASN